jgi:hypothetical protein
MPKVIRTKTITTVAFDPTVVLVDKVVSMGATQVIDRYEVVHAEVTEYGDSDFSPTVRLLGYRLSKRSGKRGVNARYVEVPPCYVTTRLPDGTVTFSSEERQRLEKDALAAAAGNPPE